MTLKITEINTIQKDEEGNPVMNISLGKGPSARIISLNLEQKALIGTDLVPIKPDKDYFPNMGKGESWVYKNKVFAVENGASVSKDELILRIKHLALKSEKDFKKIIKEVEALENFEKINPFKREKIPENVRLFVWQRDDGKCVQCGKKERLEFDHIIPVADGGGNTERNIQLLCENCNRTKGKNVV